MDGIAIVGKELDSTGEYQAQIPGSTAMARLTWTERAGSTPPVRVAEHTLVPREFEGQGIAAQLVKALIADARDRGFLIEPQCSYVAAQFRCHPEWADLLA